MLDLFDHADVSPLAQDSARIEIWRTLIERDGVAVFVAQHADMIVATAMVVTVPNLLRSGLKHGFIDNVVTRIGFQGQGFGWAVVAAALGSAWKQNCHHVLMQSGRDDPRVHHFYRSLGFEPHVRIGYVARRPADPSAH